LESTRWDYAVRFDTTVPSRDEEAEMLSAFLAQRMRVG